MNFLNVSKSGAEIRFGDGQRARVSGRLAELPDGRYTAGFRPNHMEIYRPASEAIEFHTQVSVTELTGSETFLHLKHHGANWIALVHGVRAVEPGDNVNVYLDPRHMYMFGEGGQLVAPAAYAAA